MELLRDPIRLGFAFVGPVILMLAFGYGITFDVENLKYAAFDQDQTPESRRLLESFSGSHYFSEQRPISSTAEMEQRLRSGELAVVVEIPSGFGRDLASLHPPEVAVWIDGAMPFRGETAKGYVTGLALKYAKDLAVERLGPNIASNVYLGGLNVENRFRYNQAFKSVFAMVPSVIVMMLILVPVIMSGTAVVLREGNRVDRQFSLDAHHQIRVPRRQAAAVCRRWNVDLHPPAADVAVRVPRAGQGVFRRPRARDAAVRVLDHWLRATRLDLHPDTGLGGLRERRSLRHPRSELFRSARARVLPFWPGQVYRPDVSSGLVPADQRRGLRQVARLFRPVVQHA